MKKSVSRIQEPPFAVQVELVEGCNLYCEFCGLRGIRTQREKNFKYMSLETAQSLSRKMGLLGWTSRVEFAMHGEPTMHPDIVEIVSLFRGYLPHNQLMVTSNGGGLQGLPGFDKILELFAVGLNVLAIDCYEGVSLSQKIRKRVTSSKAIEADKIAVYEYPADARGNPHSRIKAKRLVFIEDISKASHGTHSVLNNHAGAAGPPSDSAEGRRCAKPFRELSVRWDGNVAICCNDWRGIYQIGNVVTQSLEDVWQHPRFNAARQYLYHGQRVFKPCLGCDAVSTRVGLLPDKFGKETLPEPDILASKTVSGAVSQPPWAVPVIREWEK